MPFGSIASDWSLSKLLVGQISGVIIANVLGERLNLICLLIGIGSLF